MYSLKSLTNELDLEVFRASYEASFSQRSKVAKRAFSSEELKSADKVFALYFKNKMIAGFVLNYHPSRCLESFSSQAQEEIVSKLGHQNVCELVGIWKSQSAKGPATTIVMWTHIITETLKLGKPYIFGCNRSEKIGSNYYYQANYQLVSTPGDELAVFYYTRKQFLVTFFNSLFKFINKKSSTKLREAV